MAFKKLIWYDKRSDYHEEIIRITVLILSDLKEATDKIELESKFIAKIYFIEDDDKTKSINELVYDFF